MDRSSWRLVTIEKMAKRQVEKGARGPWTALDITYKGIKMSGAMGNWNRDWKVGDTVTVEVYKKGDFWNYKEPFVSSFELFNEIGDVKKMLETMGGQASASFKHEGEEKLSLDETIPPPTDDDAPPEDIPF